MLAALRSVGCILRPRPALSTRVRQAWPPGIAWLLEEGGTYRLSPRELSLLDYSNGLVKHIANNIPQTLTVNWFKNIAEWINPSEDDPAN